MAKHTFEYDDETRAISAPGHKVSEIWGIIQGEQERRADWKRTYNAALPYALAAGYRNERSTPAHLAAAHELAALCADEAHGPLDDERGG